VFDQSVGEFVAAMPESARRDVEPYWFLGSRRCGRRAHEHRQRALADECAGPDLAAGPDERRQQATELHLAEGAEARDGGFTEREPKRKPAEDVGDRRADPRVNHVARLVESAV